MIRIKRGFIAKNRRKKIVKINKSTNASSRVLFRLANQKYIKTKTLFYKNRKKRKRLFRNLWIHRINSAIRWQGLSFNQFLNLCHTQKIILNRKIISQFTIYDPDPFFQAFKSSIL